MTLKVLSIDAIFRSNPYSQEILTTTAKSAKIAMMILSIYATVAKTKVKFALVNMTLATNAPGVSQSKLR